MSYLKYLSLMLLLLLSLGMVSAENPTETLNGGGENGDVLTLNESIVIDDSNFNSYFDDDGYIINDDIKENSTIYFGNISNRNVIIDIPLNLAALNSTSQVINSTFRITDDGSGSSIRNLIFYSTLTNENNDYFSPIIVDESSDNVIEGNIINIEYLERSGNSLTGIYVFGESNNNYISGNRIAIISNLTSKTKYYVYGIQVSATDYTSYTSANYNPRYNHISYNVVDINSNYYSSGIYASGSMDTIIDSNVLRLNSSEFVYAIVCENFASSSSLQHSGNFTITNNDVMSYGSMVYMLSLFDVSDVCIEGNELMANANASYAIAGYMCSNHTIVNNNIKVTGNDVSLVGTNFDAISTGHSGIYYMKDSSNITINYNSILSVYAKGGDYAIRFDDSCTDNITITNNNLTSNNYNYFGDKAIYGYVYHINNSAYIEQGISIPDANYIIVDVYVSNAGSDSNNGSCDNPFLTINKAINYLKSLTGNIKGIIHLANGTYSSAGFNTRIYINDLNVEIIGENGTIINGESISWFFDISKSSSVTINNIHFKNGVFRQSKGGLINNKGELKLINSVFENGKVTDSSALIYNEGILDLSDNALNLNVGGAAVYNKNILYLKNNTINVLSEDSKAILNDGYIDNLVLDIFAEYENHTLLIDDYFVVLTAFLHDDNGNPISGGHLNFIMESKQFDGKSPVDDGNASFSIMSALKGTVKVSAKYSNSYTNIFVNMGYIKSLVESDGIIFYVSENGDDDKGDGSLNNSFKTINKVFSLGTTMDPVIIYLNYSTYPYSLSNFAMDDLTIVSLNNTVVSTDWKFNANANVKLANMVFYQSSVINKYSNLNIDSCSFLNSKNTALKSEYGNLTISNSNFCDNFVKLMHNINNRGGAINNAYGDLTILNTNFINNNAFYGGAIYNNQSNLYISDCNFINNLAFGGYYENVEFSFGGAISQWLGKEVFISDCLFLNNTANGYGGAFFSFGLSNYLHTKDGGWVYYDLGNNNVFRLSAPVPDSPQDIYFINCIFDSNIAPYAGGAVYIRNNSHTEYINCQFLNNAAFTYDIDKLFAHSVDRNYKLVYPNRHGQNWIYKDQMGSVTDMLFVKNDLGGAIYDESLHLSNVTFSGNTLDSGGSVLLPSIYSNPTELNHVSNSNIGLSQITSTGDAVKFVVEDSNALTGSDAKFLGIGGWQSNYNGQSINRNIEELNYQPHHSSSSDDSGDSGESGDSGGSGSSIIHGGSGNSGNSDGNGDGDGGESGSSTGGEGSGNADSPESGNVKVSLSDIYNYFASSLDKLVINNGNGVTLEDIKDMLHVDSPSDNPDVPEPVTNSSDNPNPIDNPVTNSSTNTDPVDNPVTNSSDNPNPVTNSSDISQPVDNPVTNSSTNTEPVDNPVTNSSDITNPIDDSNVIKTNNSDNNGHIENNGEVVDVGITDVILTGQSDDGVSESQSEEAPEQSEPDSSNPQNEESNSDTSVSSSTVGGESAPSYELNKKVSKELGKEDYSIIYAILLVILVIFLIIIGYYKNKRDGDEY